MFCRLLLLARRRVDDRVGPGRGATAGKGRSRFLLGPQFEQRVDPHIQVQRPDVGPEVAELLLANQHIGQDEPFWSPFFVFNEYRLGDSRGHFFGKYSLGRASLL